MLSRIVFGVTAASAILILTPSASAGPDDIAAVIVNVGPHQAVFSGTVAVGVTRPAERLEIMLVGRPQPDSAEHRLVTAALLGLAQGTLPHSSIEPLPTPSASTGPQRIRDSSLPGIRIRIPMRLTDDAVRDSVSRIVEAVNSRRYGDDTIGARIISIDHIFAGCAPFDVPTQSAAQTRLEKLAQAIGTPSATGLALQRLPTAHPFEAPPAGVTHCAGGFAIFPDASLPSSASYTYQQAFAFAKPIRFAVHASAPRAHGVWALWSGPTAGPHVHLRASGVLLTVEGNAGLERRPAGTLYVYQGPNGRWYMRDVTLESLQAIRRRLRAAGVADTAIATQLNPDDGRWYVRVQSPDVRRNEAIAVAISGTVESERDAVETTTFGDACADEENALARAVVDARARAQRVATGLGASIDLAPIAVRTGAGIGFTSCADRGMEYAPPVPLSELISGHLPRREINSNGTVTAYVVFRIRHPQLSGAVRSQVASDASTSLAARFGYIAPPIDYPDARYAANAQLETRLRPQRVQVDMTLSPDNRHGYRAIDPGLAASLAATLGASAAQYTAAFVPENLGTAMPTPNKMVFEAEFPSRGSSTEHALDAALASSQTYGYGGFSIVPESDGCAAVDDALALDVIRAAARNTSFWDVPVSLSRSIFAVRSPLTVRAAARIVASRPGRSATQQSATCV